MIRILLNFWLNCRSWLKLENSKETSIIGTLVGEKVSAIYENKERIARIGIDTCSKDDVVVYQGATAPLPTGIPTYTVQILNMCMSGCVMSHIHLSCGWFSSARLINPSVFRRLRYNCDFVIILLFSTKFSLI